MMRITGILVGICITVATFLLMLDNRETLQQETLTETIVDPTQEQLSAMVTAIAEQVDVVQAEDESDVPVAPRGESAPANSEPQGSFVEDTGNGTPEEPSDIVQARHEPDTTFPPDQVPATPDDQIQNSIDEDSSNPGTYLFWSPFRSTWAAQGFAGRLTLSTQVPVDVVSAGPGKYRVAFSYRDETERLARIERIESITGLKLE